MADYHKTRVKVLPAMGEAAYLVSDEDSYSFTPALPSPGARRCRQNRVLSEGLFVLKTS